MSTPAPSKVLVTGSVNGAIGEFFRKIDKLNGKNGPFDLLLIAGDLFDESGDDTEEVKELLGGSIKVPINTYFIAGVNPLPSSVLEKVNGNNPSGEIAENLTSTCGVMKTSQGLKIAYMGGVPEGFVPSVPNPTDEAEEKNENEDNSDVNRKRVHYTKDDVKSLIKTANSESGDGIAMVDALVTYNWPLGVTRLSNQPFNSSKSVSEPVSRVCHELKPRYHFSSGESLYYEREAWYYSDDVKIGKSPNQHKHYTRFIGLGGLKTPTKTKWLYALNLTPLSSIIQNGGANDPQPPKNATGCPLRIFDSSEDANGNTNGNKRKAEDLDGGDGATNPQNKMAKRTPPDGYICRKCKKPGHFLRDCTDAEKEPSTPPEGYMCKICKNPGHWIQRCPERVSITYIEGEGPGEGENEGPTSLAHKPPPESYICHACNQPGHWIQNCPERISRSKDKKKHQEISNCWFCLANPDVNKQLIVAIGDEAYLAMAKGGLVADNNNSSDESTYTSPIPGGGHMLIIPISHITNLRDPSTMKFLTDKPRHFANISTEAWSDCNNDISRFKKALTECFAKFDCAPVFFDICRNANHQHSHIQVVPIPISKKQEIRQFFQKIAKDESVILKQDFHENPYFGFFRVDLPDGDAPLICQIPPRAYFNLQFGRHVLAKFLGMPKREDWKACVLEESDEIKATQNFTEAFKPYNFTL
ncbi:hypothetical protein H4219_000178 [Mycoemilia scoparia]|uniref:CCHC-type domain-containing protein n=1 Tax=Mycoemilia scoparia TaxID=417184 RepID=A0A9W8DXT1_9FUNG|nr:hypothetical protein H4219_000178 [Mycoemilia scoparia]